MHNRDRLTPVTLPRKDPVTHAVVDGFLSFTALCQPRHHTLLAGLRRQAVELPGVDHVAWANVRRGLLLPIDIFGALRVLRTAGCARPVGPRSSTTGKGEDALRRRSRARALVVRLWCRERAR